MPYTRHTWESGEVISSEKMNNIEDGIEEGLTDIVSEDITDASNVGKSILTAADAVAARTAIGAGTSNLTIGTTGTTAKVGNYTPTTSEVSNALKSKTQINALTPIADTATAEASDIAEVVNLIIAALKA